VAPALPIAKLSKAHVERDGTIIPVDLRPLVDKGTLTENIQLQPGDKLVVPENKDYVYLMGPVAKPGISLYPDDRKLTVSKFLVEAGMAPQQAEDKQTMVIRSMPDGTTQKFVVNVEDMLKTGDFSKDMELQPGDYVFVPFKRGSGTQRALNTLSQVGFAVGGVIGVQQVLRLLGF
jgi:protein involved in polysaccharide export with SLBB domain